MFDFIQKKHKQIHRYSIWKFMTGFILSSSNPKDKQRLISVVLLVSKSLLPFSFSPLIKMHVTCPNCWVCVLLTWPSINNRHVTEKECPQFRMWYRSYKPVILCCHHDGRRHCHCRRDIHFLSSSSNRYSLYITFFRNDPHTYTLVRTKKSFQQWIGLQTNNIWRI